MLPKGETRRAPVASDPCTCGHKCGAHANDYAARRGVYPCRLCPDVGAACSTSTPTWDADVIAKANDPCKCGHARDRHEYYRLLDASVAYPCGVCYLSGAACDDFVPAGAPHRKLACTACGHEFSHRRWVTSKGPVMGMCGHRDVVNDPCPCLLWTPEPPTWVQAAFLKLVNTRILALGGPVIGCGRCAAGNGYSCNGPGAHCMVRLCAEHAYAAPECEGESNLLESHVPEDYPWVLRDGWVRCPAHREAGDILIGSYVPEVIREGCNYE